MDSLERIAADIEGQKGNIEEARQHFSGVKEAAENSQAVAVQVVKALRNSLEQLSKLHKDNTADDGRGMESHLGRSLTKIDKARTGIGSRGEGNATLEKDAVNHLGGAYEDARKVLGHVDNANKVVGEESVVLAGLIARLEGDAVPEYETAHSIAEGVDGQLQQATEATETGVAQIRGQG